MPVKEEHFTTIAIVNAPQFNVYFIFCRVHQPQLAMFICQKYCESFLDNLKPVFY